MKVAVYGRSGSGESTISQYLAETYGFTYCHPGAYCRRLASELFNDTSKAVLNKLSDSLRDINASVWLRASMKDIPASASVVFDGMRFRSDYDYFTAESFILWKVEAAQTLRYERLRLRGQEYDPRADDEHPGEWVLQHLPFDATIVNDGDMLSLHRTVGLLMENGGKLPNGS